MELKLQTTQAIYSPDEAIELLVLLENDHDTPLWINSRMGVKRQDSSKGELLFSIHTEEGNIPFQARINMGDVTDEDFSLVAPETWVGKVVDLGLYFDLSSSGTYLVEATYFNDQSYGDQQKTFISKGLKATPIRIHIQ